MRLHDLLYLAAAHAAKLAMLVEYGDTTSGDEDLWNAANINSIDSELDSFIFKRSMVANFSLF